MSAKSIFVLMPFKEEFDDVYLVIRDAVATRAGGLRADIVCQRADEIARPGKISEQILESIRKAELIIADLTGNNPNVMYELGYAHALGKHTIILNQDVHQAPFDVKDFRQILYDRGRLMKDCRPRIISAVSDLFGETLPADHGPTTATASDNPDNPLEALPTSPLRPGAKLVALLQHLHLKLQLANKTADGKAVRSLGKEVRELLDRVTVVGASDHDDVRNTAGVTGNCAVELERAELQDEAENVYKRAIGLFPDHEGLHLQYSDLLVDLGRLDEASSELERAKALNPVDRRLANLEMKLALAGRKPLPEVGAVLRQGFEEHPADLRAAMSYLMYLTKTGASLSNFEEACKKWEDALSPDLKHLAIRALADKLASDGAEDSRDRAIQLYESLLALPATNKDDRHAVCHNIATMYAIAGKVGPAKERWTEAYRMKPGDPAVQAAFSQRLADWGEFDLAVKVAAGELI